jgi:hypothetical protein
MSPYQDDLIQIVDRKELDETIKRALDRSHYSLEQLREQARRGRFETERARLTWQALRAVVSS